MAYPADRLGGRTDGVELSRSELGRHTPKQVCDLSVRGRPSSDQQVCDSSCSQKGCGAASGIRDLQTEPVAGERIIVEKSVPLDSSSGRGLRQALEATVHYRACSRRPRALPTVA